MNKLRKQSGMLEGYFLLAAIAGAAVILIATGAIAYSKGKSAVQAKWDADTAAKIIANDAAKQKQVGYVANLVRDSLAQQAAIDKLSNDIKSKGLANETSKFCPAAPSGSVIVTPNRLRDLKALYK